MTYALINGDYEKDSVHGDLKKCDYLEELLQNIVLALTAQRGKFYPDKNYGSYIRACLPLPTARYAEAYARQALGMLDGVLVKRAEVQQNKLIFYLDINGNERVVILPYHDEL